MRSGYQKKNETNNEVQSLITKMSNDEFERKNQFLINGQKQTNLIESELWDQDYPIER